MKTSELIIKCKKVLEAAADLYEANFEDAARRELVALRLLLARELREPKKP